MLWFKIMKKKLIIQVEHELTLMVSKGWPVSTKHTPPAPPAMKFFKADGGAFFLTGSSVLIISALF